MDLKPLSPRQLREGGLEQVRCPEDLHGETRGIVSHWGSSKLKMKSYYGKNNHQVSCLPQGQLGRTAHRQLENLPPWVFKQYSDVVGRGSEARVFIYIHGVGQEPGTTRNAGNM